MGVYEKKSTSVAEYNIYTDLALEEREKFKENVEIPGVILVKEKNQDLEITVTSMKIENEKGAETMGKPVGNYITIEARGIMNEESPGGESECQIADVIAKEIRKVVEETGGIKESKILVVGLGNEKATPDALGPLVAGRINIKENLICIIPGVLAQTGMETYKIVKGIVNEEKPDLVIAIDSLAARNASRVATTVQITDTGIIPGSGIGNHRMGLNRETLEIPVIAVGVPMVVNSVTIVHDTVEQLLNFLSGFEELEDMTRGFSIFDSAEKYAFIDEIMSKGIGKMYVTPKDVDDIVSRLSSIIAYAINVAVS